MSKDFVLGFIGCGNMATAIISGAVNRGGVSAQNIFAFDTDDAKMKSLQKGLGINTCASISDIGKNTDIIVLAVKPNVVPLVLEQIDVPNKAIVSIAAAVDCAKIRASLKVPARILRIMPNTPLMIGKGASVFATPSTLTEDELAFVRNLFENMGIVKTADEALMHAVTGVSGSGPAYVYMFIEALAKAGEAQGLSYDMSLELATQTVIGAANMAQQSEKTPEQLKIDVCSPGGTTIEAVNVFNTLGLNTIVEKAVKAATDKSKIM